ncbi:hypothetical protein CKM354_000037500 [Cercospora kikuchii]|uniref:Pentapeptide repeat-containing protein n=1 Tax=Cercospora kikuchii TaxID=84275 RepID=A0A9P3C3R7_9PEZI|nr:uncharacterized protein CKM354_000037500 [Cercospora kikuchii]GIZ36909.1 hypothetical protein CKM354_000037500 [Cercospora kikuchii]
MDVDTTTHKYSIVDMSDDGTDELAGSLQHCSLRAESLNDSERTTTTAADHCESEDDSEFDDSDYSENDSLDDLAPPTEFSKDNKAASTATSDESQGAIENDKTKSEIPEQLIENRDLVFKPMQPDHGLKIILGKAGRFQNVHFVNCTFEHTTIFENCALFNVTFTRCHFEGTQFVNSVISRLKSRIPKDSELEIIDIIDMHFDGFLCTNTLFRDEWQLTQKIQDRGPSLGETLPGALSRPEEEDWWIDSDADEDSDESPEQYAQGFGGMPEGVESYGQRLLRYAKAHGTSSFDVTSKGCKDDGLRFKEGPNELYTAVKFQDCVLDEVVFENCVVYGVSFQNCNFRRVHFKDTVLIDCVFRNCTADGLRWEGARQVSVMNLGTRFGPQDNECNAAKPKELSDRSWISSFALTDPSAESVT